ncbi:MAG TPA: FlgT C-terminal domain-containing protein [Candidatus Heimdallarchaeota archaeon]|nr:FlgT C-terminal domain-containing protein [Candidatus Heimdallarchaeota archaeon]
MATSSHSGRVIKVEGNKVWVNIGANAGIKIGDEFEVIRKGEKLIDPDTGLALGSTEESVGKIVVVEVEEKYSVATIQGGNAQAQDYLKKM